jgi:RND family efflux transporter MFP subunit
MITELTIRMTLAAVFVPMTLAVLCCGCQSESGAQTDAAQLQSEELVRVKVVRHQNKNKKLERTTTQPATLHAYYQAELFAKVSGYLKELKVDIGDPVETGDVLGTIDIPEMDKARERQEATICRLKTEEKRSQAGIDLAKANVQATEASRDQAKADIDKTNAQLTADRAEFVRVQELVSTKSIAGRLLDEARKKLESSQASKISAQAAFDSAVANVSVANSKQAVAEAELDASKSATDVAGKQLEEMDALMAYATLKSPFKGVVVQRNVDPGDLVRNIQTASNNRSRPLFVIAQLDKIRVRIAIPENEVPWTDVGDTVTLQMRAIPERTFSGKISRVARALDESTRTMLVEVDLPNPEKILIPGMYCEATIILEKKSDALMLPAGAVRYALMLPAGALPYKKTDVSFVYVVDSGGTIRIQEVTTGLDDGKQIEITGGLDENDRVVGSMIGRLQAGQKVQVEEE